MRLAAAQMYRYRLPLARPLALGGATLTHRSGLVVALHDDAGEIRYGDIAPLPGFSTETLDEAASEARRLVRSMLSSPRHGQPAHVHGIKDRADSFDNLSGPPSVLFGLQSALVGCGRAGTRPAGVLVNALVAGPDEDAARDLVRAGYTSAKLKVGRNTVEEDATRVRDFWNALEGQVALRLDANRAWDSAAALRFSDQIRDVSVEYIEEPVDNAHDLERFAESSRIPVAIDETARDVEDASAYLAANDYITAVVLKPTLLPGAIAGARRWAEAAREHGVTPVISSAFESGLGVAALASLASELMPESVPAGLDTYKWLAADVLSTRFAVRNGALELRQVNECASSVDLDRCEKVWDVSG